MDAELKLKLLVKLNSTQKNDEMIINQLRKMAISKHGLVNNAIRRQMWPILIGSLQASKQLEKPSFEQISNFCLIDCYFFFQMLII